MPASFFRAALILGLFALVPLQAEAAEPKYKIRWIIEHGPESLIKEATDRFANTLRKESKGEIGVEVTLAKIGYEKDAMSPRVALQKVAANEFQMGQIYAAAIGEMDSRFWVFDLPFRFENYKQVSKALDGAVGQEILDGLVVKTGSVRGLAFTYSGGLRIVLTNGKAIEKASDFASLKIATYNSPVSKAVMEHLRAVPANIPKIDIPAAMEKGSIDGFESTYTRIGSAGEEKMFQVLNETNHSVHLTAFVINDEFFRSLPAKYQALVRKTAREVALIERRVALDDGAATKARLAKNGTTVMKLSAAALKELRSQTASLAKAFPQYFSADLADRLQASGR